MKPRRLQRITYQGFGRRKRRIRDGVLLEKIEVKGTMRRPRLRWQSNIKMGGVVRTNFIWFGIGNSGGILLTR
jgi:hypothetical protein